MDKTIKKATILLGVFLLFIGVAYAGPWVYQMSATVGVNTDVSAYLDSACTTSLPASHNWGNVLDGDSKEFWIKNVGTVPVDVTITILDEDKCTVTANPTTVTNLARFATSTITLTINTQESAGVAINWDVQIDSVEYTP